MMVLSGHEGEIHALAYAPGDGQTLASGSADGTVRLWNPCTRRTWATFSPRVHTVETLAFSHDGSLLAVAGRAVFAGGRFGVVSLWDPGLEQPRDLLDAGGAPEVARLAFSPVETELACACPYNPASRQHRVPGLALWRPDFRDIFYHVPFPGGVSDIAYAADGKTLAVARLHNWYVELWDGGARHRQSRLRYQGPIACLAFAPVADGEDRLLLAAATRRVVDVRNPATAEKWQLKGHRGDVQALAFAPDGRTLLTGGRDATVRLWDVATGEERACFDWGVGRVRAVAFSPDGMTAAVAGEGQDIVIWDRDESR
jgi:WD40 repeat protein